MAIIGKIENGRGYPDPKKEGTHYWVKQHNNFSEYWEICIWDGFCFLGYGLQDFNRKIVSPKEYQEIKKPK